MTFVTFIVALVMLDMDYPWPAALVVAATACIYIVEAVMEPFTKKAARACASDQCPCHQED